jgi:hypothetical protein
VLRQHHIQDVCNGGCSEEELRALLADERGTARRQELLKAFWKLSQQREEDSHIRAKKAAAGSATTRQSSAMPSQQGKSLSISC